jgi:site-specific recombinase XerD
MSKRSNENNQHLRHDLEALIDLYWLRCQVEGKSPNTIKAYTETLKRFARIAKEEDFPKDVRHITPNHIYTYLGRFTHYTLETRHRYFREVRCFFNWLVNAGYLQKNPFRSLHNVRLPQKIVRPFSPEEITRLLAANGHRTLRPGVRLQPNGLKQNVVGSNPITRSFLLI